MEFRRVLALRGPNVWARFPVLEILLDLSAISVAGVDAAAFRQRLEPWQSAIAEVAGAGPLPAAGKKLDLPAELAGLTLALQTLPGAELGFAKVLEAGEAHTHRLIVQFEDEKFARDCLHAAREIVLSALAGPAATAQSFTAQSLDVGQELARLRQIGDRYCLGPSTRAMVRAATNRGIPYLRLNDSSLVQLGHAARQHRLNTAVTDHTSGIAEGIAQDKDLTRRLLSAVGVPVPDGRAVNSEEDAWQAACEVGLPVVVKPQNANHGRGVSINLAGREQVIAAYRFALPEGDGVIVERFVRGAEHRLLVVGERMVAAARGEPEQVLGDGKHTVRELVDQLNQDPRRSVFFASQLTFVELDPLALLILEQQGYTPESVPPRGQNVLIHRNGDYTIDETDEVHPDVAYQAVLAARVVGLDIAGIDLIAADISRPLAEQAGAVVEVNAGPSLAPHLKPVHGRPRPVAEAIVDTLFAPEDSGRIQIVAISELPAEACTTRLIGHLFSQAGQRVGLACSQGLFVGAWPVRKGDCREAHSARSVLLNPLAEIGVFEVARQSAALEGFGCDACNTAVLVADEPAGATDTECQANTDRALTGALLPGGCLVFSAANVAAVRLAEGHEGPKIVIDPSGATVVSEKTRSQGGRAVLVRNETVILAEAAQERELLALAELPWLDAQSNSEVLYALAAIAAAWSLELPLEELRAGLRSFSNA